MILSLCVGDVGCAGSGSIMMRAKTQVETLSLGGGRQARNALIVTELPYQVNKVRKQQRWRESLGWNNQPGELR